MTSLRLTAILLSGALPFAVNAHASPGSTCNLLIEGTVRQLTGIGSGHFTATPKGPTTCVYTFPGAPAQTDDNGRPRPAPTLTLEHRRFPTDAEAHALLLARGDPADTTTSLFTEDPVADELGDLERQEGDPESNEYLVLRGATARHGGNVVIIGMNDGVNEPSNGDALLQSTVLTLAGAHLTAAERIDLCARFPVAALQTLISLGPSTGQSTGSSFAENTNTCAWKVVSDESKRPATIKITVQQFPSAELALKQLKQDAPSHQNITPIPRSTDPTDKAFSHRHNDPEAEAVHGAFLAHLTIKDAQPEATAIPSYAGRLESIALKAAGANLPPDPAIPLATPPQPRAAGYALNRLLSGLWNVLGLQTIPFAVLLLVAAGWLRKRRLRVTGMPGTAVVTGISDTGLTINNDPQVRLELSVTPQGGSPYPAHVRMVVSRLAPGGLVGQTLNVRIDRKNPQRLVVV